MLKLIGETYGDELATKVSEQCLLDRIRQPHDLQRMPYRVRLGIHHPKLLSAIEMMERYQVRRLPVIADHKLVGIISQGDIARNYSEQRVGELVEHISERKRMNA